MHGRPWQLAANLPGKRTSIPFARRDGCRVVIHRERFNPEDGTQDLTVDVDVTKLDDNPRSDAHVSERMVLRPSPESRIFWIRGVKAQFDRVTVRIAHVADDARYVGASETRTSLPAVQWTLVVGEGHLRFYATAAIPTGLFHITAPSGILTLNFGVLSRLTWLDQQGHEGLVGLELGAMGISLATTADSIVPRRRSPYWVAWASASRSATAARPPRQRSTCTPGSPTSSAATTRTCRGHPRSRPATGRFSSDRASPSATSERISERGRYWHDLCSRRSTRSPQFESAPSDQQGESHEAHACHLPRPRRFRADLWTIAMAADAPPADAPAKKEKKSKKSKKAAEGDKKAEKKAE